MNNFLTAYMSVMALFMWTAEGYFLTKIHREDLHRELLLKLPNSQIYRMDSTSP